MFKFFKKDRIKPQKSNVFPVERNSALRVLDECAEVYSFPMLDNGYVYLAASRSTVYHGDGDWALVIEVFGFSPRAGAPDLAVHTFGSNLRNRKPNNDFVSNKAHENYLKNNRYNEFKTFFPIGGDDTWVNPEDNETVMPDGAFQLRDQVYKLPDLAAYLQHGIKLEGATPCVYELCRYLSSAEREKVLATDFERRYNVPDHLAEIISLDDWRHPDLANGEKPSEVETFRQLSKVLETGNAAHYKPTTEANTHWKHWPDSGLL